MNEDEMQALEPQAGAELERQLARYARVRLDPTPAQARRARASVMEAAWRRRLERVQAPERPTAGPRRRAPFAAWSVRRMATSLSAAVLAGLLVGSVTFAGSRAGGPLYEARLQLEALTLPTDPDARLEAELAQAQSRLAEVVEAAGRNDQGALDAALGAYDSAIDGLSTANGVPADRALEAVQFHRMVLLRLVDTAPVQALGGLENALSHSSSVIDRLGAAGTGAGADAGPGGPGSNDAGTSGTGNDGGPNAGGNGGSNAGGNGGSNAGGNGGSNKGGGNAATPAPTERPAPSRAPAPGKAPKPAASPDNGPGQDSP